MFSLKFGPLTLLDTMLYEPLSLSLPLGKHSNPNFFSKGFESFEIPGPGETLTGTATVSIPTEYPGPPTTLAYNQTFGRGGWPTNSEGLVEFRTIYPGYCEPRFVGNFLSCFVLILEL